MMRSVTVLLALPLASAFMVPMSVVPRPAIATRASSAPAMMLEPDVVNALHTSTLALADTELLKDFSELTPGAAFIVIAVYAGVAYAILQATLKLVPTVLKAGFVIACVELFGGFFAP